MRVKVLFFLLFAIFCSCIRTKCQGFLRTDGQRIVNAQGDNVLLRGIGLGGWMLQEGYMLHLYKEGQQYRIKQRISSLIGEENTSAFYNAWLRNHTTRSDMDSLHAWGFNSVRLPMHYNLFTLSVDQEPEAGKNTWLRTGFELTDSLVSWCKANHMYVILDLHAAPGGQGNDLNISDRDPSRPSLWQSEANKQKTIALWQKIAARYSGEPTVGGYDILNEPNWGFEDTLNDRNGLKEEKNIQLKQLLMDITHAIREVDKNHLIIIEGNGWGNNYKGMLGPWDHNMVLSFHKYWNLNDQHSIQYMLDFRSQYNVPVWIGETGENSNTWFTDAIRLFENNNIGWSWWPLKKLGNSNPLQIKSSSAYDSLVNYWTGKSPQPPVHVYDALMDLAYQTKCENNIVHRDVVDAMMRQPFGMHAIPFKSNKISNGTVMYAVDYDLGPNGVAYYDMDTANYRTSTGKESAGNRGRVYRNDGVDIYEDSIQKGSFYVGHTEDGEWLQYTIDVQEAGRYDLKIAVSPGDRESAFSVGTDSVQEQKTIRISSTGGNENWEPVIAKNLFLKKGPNPLRIRIDKGGFKLKSITFQTSTEF
jgi:aryl-phospho-beta-D-glucosidase BglC (GH1 family)